MKHFNRWPYFLGHYNFRSAITGDYVTEQFAKDHPETTVKEKRTMVKVPKAPKIIVRVRVKK